MGGGIKVGNFGTGGRSYVSRSSQATPSSCSGEEVSYCCGFCTLIALIVLGYAEHNLFLTRTLLHEAADTAVSLTSASSADLLVDNNPVHVLSDEGTLSLSEEPMTDSYFGISFDGAAVQHRETQYCQWEEKEHRHKRTIGRKPDQCI